MRQALAGLLEYITERKVQARDAAAARGATAKKPVTRYDAPYTPDTLS